MCRSVCVRRRNAHVREKACGRGKQCVHVCLYCMWSVRALCVCVHMHVCPCGVGALCVCMYVCMCCVVYVCAACAGRGSCVCV